VIYNYQRKSKVSTNKLVKTQIKKKKIKKFLTKNKIETFTPKKNQFFKYTLEDKYLKFTLIKVKEQIRKVKISIYLLR